MVRTNTLFKLFDWLIVSIISIPLTPIMLLGLSISYVCTRRPIFIQERVGLNGKIFRLYKIRTLPKCSPNIPTHQLPDIEISPGCKFLRKTHIDETLQIINVVLGDMSLIGPRPSLPSQLDIIQQRTETGVIGLRPGVTGPAQALGADMSKPERLARIERRFFKTFGACQYFYWIYRTGIKVSTISRKR